MDRFLTKRRAQREASRRLIETAKLSTATGHSSGNSRRRFKTRREYLWWKVVETTPEEDNAVA